MRFNAARRRVWGQSPSGDHLPTIRRRRPLRKTHDSVQGCVRESAGENYPAERIFLPQNHVSSDLPSLGRRGPIQIPGPIDNHIEGPAPNGQRQDAQIPPRRRGKILGNIAPPPIVVLLPGGL
jgi:hypothetical protein